MEKRLDKEELLKQLKQWDSFLKRKIYLIACGGTAMTLLGVKASTRDIDFMVPKESDYKYLIKTLGDIGYKSKSGSGWARADEPFVFDLFAGKRIHTTELLDDPLEEGRHQRVFESAHIYLGILNDYDLIVSKLFRGTGVDFDDCLTLVAAHIKTLDRAKLKEHYFEMLSFHTIGEDRLRGHWDSFERQLKEMS